MHTRAGGMHIGHGQYAYHLLWYAYCLCPICVPPALVRILDMDNMRTRAGGMHIVRVRYAYTLIVRILDTDDMRTRAGSTHIVCVRYAYYLLWCACWTWMICIQIIIFIDTYLCVGIGLFLQTVHLTNLTCNYEKQS